MAESMELNRSEFLEWAVLKALGHSPKLTVTQKLSDIERRLSLLEAVVERFRALVGSWGS